MAIDKTKASIFGAILFSVGVGLMLVKNFFSTGLALTVFGAIIIFLCFWKPKRKFETRNEYEEYRRSKARELGRKDAYDEED